SSDLDAINHAACLAKDFVGSGLIAGVDCLANALDGGAQHRAQAGVVLVKRNRLAGALACLSCIGHEYPVKKAKSKCKAHNSSPVSGRTQEKTACRAVCARGRLSVQEASGNAALYGIRSDTVRIDPALDYNHETQVH